MSDGHRFVEDSTGTAYRCPNCGHPYASSNRAAEFQVIRNALLDALAKVYDLPLSDTGADIITEAIQDAIPNHVAGGSSSPPTPTDSPPPQFFVHTTSALAGYGTPQPNQHATRNREAWVYVRITRDETDALEHALYDGEPSHEQILAMQAFLRRAFEKFDSQARFVE